jgi:hypothetical protein
MTRPDIIGARRLIAVLALVSLGAAFSPSGAQAQESPVGCGYGTGGPYARNLCWFDMSGYTDVKGRSPEGQQMSITLPGGYVAKFTLTSRQVPGHLWRGVEPRAAPIETRFAFGKGGYVGILASPRCTAKGRAARTASN